MLAFLSGVCSSSPSATPSSLLRHVCRTLPELNSPLISTDPDQNEDNDLEQVRSSDHTLSVVAWLGELASQLYPGTTPLHLPDCSAANLRGSLLHGWKGSTREGVRDSYLETTKSLLLVLHHDWTLETAVSSGGGSDSKDDSQSMGHFASLVCSITCGEFRILCDEFVSILESHLPTAGGDDGGDGDGDTRRSHSEKAAQIQARLARIVRMHATCFDLFDAMLGLLVGEAGEEGGAWACLPASVLIHFHGVSRVNVVYVVLCE